MLLDIARLLLQKDTREALKELVQLIRRHPEWKKDFVEIAEGFTAPEADKARVLVKFIAEVLAQKGWPSSRTGVVEYGIQELVDNAFTHGSRTATAGTCVRIKAVLTSHWAKCEVSDTGDGFDLDTILRLQKQGEVRGLTTVHGLVRTLTQPSPNSIEVFIDQRPAGVSRYRHQGADVICMKGDLHINTRRYHRGSVYQS